MGRYSDIAARLKNETRRDDIQEKTFDGHRVSRVVWETAAAVVFADDKGHFWRYLHAYGQCWKVVVLQKTLGRQLDDHNKEAS
jgi:hypothetical protein